MSQRLVLERTDGRHVDITITDRDDGDFHIDNPSTLDRRAQLTAEPWVVVRQIHSARVVDAAPGAEPVEADAILTHTSDLPIAVQGADCAPIALSTLDGPIAVAHVGWRGLVGGVIEETIDQLGEIPNTAIVGPTICPACYEFSAQDLDLVAAKYGDDVRGTTSTGTPALDMTAGIRRVLVDAGVADIRFAAGCTACGAAGFSHRQRKDVERHALVAVLREGPHGR
ncbi:MAG: polyphenol oxidase family protein [Acidimicrobiales bacterium]|nr:polyphenol oxidase family protein [Acidimicrobiales bacterium]RZV41661.1 MAG: laccase domain-containing protein [Acidimicrobiales bacterium]